MHTQVTAIYGVMNHITWLLGSLSALLTSRNRPGESYIDLQSHSVVKPRWWEIKQLRAVTSPSDLGGTQRSNVQGGPINGPCI